MQGNDAGKPTWHMAEPASFSNQRKLEHVWRNMVEPLRAGDAQPIDMTTGQYSTYPNEETI